MIDAVIATRVREPVLAHASAAVVWGIPIVGPHLADVHLHTAGRSVARTKNGVVWHHDRLADGDVVELEGMLVTSFARTVFDLARTLPFATAVAAMDYAIGSPRSPDAASPLRLDRAELAERVASWTGRPGVRKARAAVVFADSRSGSPGESISRAHMHTLGFPRPELQVAFPREGGGYDVVDFDWPEHGTFGEFDGAAKYLKPEFTRGRSMNEVVADEKARENRVRRHRPFAVRWDWQTAIRPQRLARELRAVGLRPVR